MTEIEQLLQRQARWQKARKALSWPEKIRMAEQVRAFAAQWRSAARKTTGTSHASKKPRPSKEPA
jgi:hypothetical protein